MSLSSRIFGVLVFVQGYAITETTESLIKAIFGGVISTIVAYLTKEFMEYVKETLNKPKQKDVCNGCKIK